MVRVLASVAAFYMLCGVQAAPTDKATVKETTRSTAATSDALITFDALKSVAYQTGVYWVDFAKFSRDTAVSMLSKGMQVKYNEVVRDGNKYYAQAKDVYYAEVAPKINSIIDAGVTSAKKMYSFVNEKQKSLSTANLKILHAAYPGTRGVVGSELADRLVFIFLSMTLFSWAVYLLKLPFQCLGYMLCPRRAKKSVRSGVAGQSEKAKAQHGKGSPTPTKNFKGKKQN
ncbi:hypothetical protein Pmar_PMAR001106 [Perkinsus marinus ATCC 50983]|uniref:Uncharacterized protein n=1 Tax=Perkinsus marinus (strain ATCC 50983 / TXsc) TaxID=423536 RepID=C5KSV9_PERM5|nr:hypothetical protein Pmar_PMAR001106 [Perkinsus marinus ATCC 50983]EER12309.1 hypothetical protein Pmar_PMAR001106 [Perkinsus marinus ATCC 50983]|eukprot:XP_002780514.1 hypothetical protein Pmar_PMAR001106 [Perkinsus marinus ATCC 50983]